MRVTLRTRNLSLHLVIDHPTQMHAQMTSFLSIIQTINTISSIERNIRRMQRVNNKAIKIESIDRLEATISLIDTYVQPCSQFEDCSSSFKVVSYLRFLAACC
eukprot:826846_1